MPKLPQWLPPVKRILVSLILIVVFFILPIVPQLNLMEVMTQEGGTIERSYEIDSLKEIFEDLECALHCFPSTDETVRFNITAIILSFVVLAALLYVWNRWIARRLKCK